MQILTKIGRTAGRLLVLSALVSAPTASQCISHPTSRSDRGLWGLPLGFRETFVPRSKGETAIAGAGRAAACGAPLITRVGRWVRTASDCPSFRYTSSPTLRISSSALLLVITPAFIL